MLVGRVRYRVSSRYHVRTFRLINTEVRYKHHVNRSPYFVAQLFVLSVFFIYISVPGERDFPSKWVSSSEWCTYLARMPCRITYWQRSFLFFSFRKPRTKRGKRILLKKEPKVVENAKHCVFIPGRKSSQNVSSCMKDLVRSLSDGLRYARFGRACTGFSSVAS